MVKIRLNFVAVSAFLKVAIMSILIKVIQNDIRMKENPDFKFYFSYLHVPLCIGSKISAKIKSYILSTAKLLCSLCHEIPCRCKKLYESHRQTFLVQKNNNFILVIYQKNCKLHENFMTAVYPNRYLMVFLEQCFLIIEDFFFVCNCQSALS